MPENNIVKLPINQVYTVLKKEHLTYQEKHSSLNKKNNAELLMLIQEELESSKGLMQQLNSDILTGLINPKFKHVADKFVKETNNTLTVESSAIKQQLDEFIGFSELLFLILTKANIWTKTQNITTLQNFASLTKLKFNLFLDNLNQFLISTNEENSELIRIAKILITHYFPAVAVASYDGSTKLILLAYSTDVASLKDAIEKKDIPSLQKNLDTYQKNISRQKETFISADTSDIDEDEDYHSCYEFPVNETKDPNQSDNSDRDSYYSCEDENKDEEFFDALENLTDQSLPSKEQSNTSNQGLLQRLINWFRKLIYNLTHIIHRTRETPPSTRLSTEQDIEPLIGEKTDTASITSSIASEKSARTPILPIIATCKRNSIVSSTDNSCSFFRNKEDKTKTVDNRLLINGLAKCSSMLLSTLKMNMTF